MSARILSSCFMVSCFISKYFIHLVFILIEQVKYRFSFSFFGGGLYLSVNGLSPVPASSPKQSIFLFLL